MENAGGDGFNEFLMDILSFWCANCLCSWIRSYLPPKNIWGKPWPYHDVIVWHSLFQFSLILGIIVIFPLCIPSRVILFISPWFMVSWNTRRKNQSFFILNTKCKDWNITVDFWATSKPIRPIPQVFYLFWSALKKLSWDFNFLYAFKILASNRYEKGCQTFF